MPKTITLQLSPKQAADEKFYIAQAARTLSIRQSDIALARVVKRSIDARQRMAKVNLTLEIYVDQEPQPVLYSQSEGDLGCFKVSFSSPTFAIQTSELQLLTNNFWIDKIEERWPLLVATSLRFTEHKHSPSLCYYACGQLGFAASLRYSANHISFARRAVKVLLKRAAAREYFMP